MVYVSTGGIKNLSAYEISKMWHIEGLNAIELSGGSYCGKQLAGLKILGQEVDFQLHNYFPPPMEPFVFNLASLNTEIAERSVQHVQTALRSAIELNKSIYSFHAGFLMDPKVEDLGKRITPQILADRSIAMDIFLSRVNCLADTAKNMGVKLLIENNVLSKNNFKNFNGNPFLMATAEECLYVMKNTPSNVGLLLDVAHLKVSANSLNFDPVSFLKQCNDYICGYHLSDNDGTRDSNQPINIDSWFWPYLRRDLSYYTLEVYNLSAEQLLYQSSMVDVFLGQKCS